MIVDLAALRLGKIPLLVNRPFDKEEFEFEDENIELSGPVQVDLSMIASEERVRVRGHLKAGLILTCCRCACRFDWAVEKDFAVEYWPDKTEEEEIELDYDDLDIGFYVGDKFDLRPVIVEQMLIDIPMNPICREECKGLCERCGADLNREACSCRRGTLDPRLESLRALKDRMK